MRYLKDEIVDDILRFAASLPPPSEIVFSFIPPERRSRWRRSGNRTLDGY